MKLNCDLGENFGAWKVSDDQHLMPYVDMASIACGYHAGDPVVMRNAIESAIHHNVSVGAHTSYPDLQGFGRRSMKIPARELIPMIQYQIAALDGMAQTLGARLSYVKPHGALYNDMMLDDAVFMAVVDAVNEYYRMVPLVIQATPRWEYHQKVADNLNLPIMFEVFADRCYQADGRLVPRDQPGAVLEYPQMLEQVQYLFEHKAVKAQNGEVIPIKADTLCVHGDSEDALKAVKAIREMITP